MTADTWAAIAVTAITLPYLAFAAVLALAGWAHRRRQARTGHETVWSAVTPPRPAGPPPSGLYGATPHGAKGHGDD